MIAAGGAIGAGARHGLLLLWPIEPGRLPLTILVENVAGAFLLGVLAAMVLEGARSVPRLHPLLGTGVLGSFTTFSNLSVDLVHLLETGRHAVALLYIMLSVGLGMLAVLAGVMLVRVLRKSTPSHRRRDP